MNHWKNIGHEQSTHKCTMVRLVGCIGIKLMDPLKFDGINMPQSLLRSLLIK
jgi:hypothetical protein